MSDYSPDNWVVIRVLSGDKPTYKVLAGWSGGYTQGDSWRMNSGIESVSFEGDCFLFKGFSGSVYRCHKDAYCLRMNNAHVWEEMRTRFPDKVSLMDEDTDWLAVDWG